MSTNEILCKRSTTILELIAKGLNYDQIIRLNKNVTYPDIFNAAKEALDIIDSARPVQENKLRDAIDTVLKKKTPHQKSVAKMKKQYPRAYERWSKEEERDLKDLYRKHLSINEVAAALQRQPGAISSRLARIRFVEGSSSS